MRTGHISPGQIAAFLRRARLNPHQWDLAEITRKTNAWIADNLTELSQMDADWRPEDKAAHLAEFGSLAAVDFLEQCVIEAGPATAPWRELWQRVDTGEFDHWPPIWTAHPRH